MMGRGTRNILLWPESGSGLPPFMESALRQSYPEQSSNLADEAVLQSGLACFDWFYQALRYPVRTWKLKRLLNRHGIPLVTWNRDAPHYLNRASWRLNLLDVSQMFDIYATHSLADEGRTFAGLQLYLPNAADLDNYSIKGDADQVLARLRQDGSYRYDVSFFGAMDGDRYKEMREREVFFKELSGRLSSMGIRYLFREASGMSVGEQIRLIQESKISLNFGASCEYGFPQAFGLPERCYGIPAVGGFLLCDKRVHARDDFTVGENWAEFDGLDDCVSQIQYWLSHFDAARHLAEKCYHHVMSHHTYQQRAEKLLGAIHDWRNGRRGLIR